MPTVPNWIAKAVIIDPSRREVWPIVEWRATKTQVIVRTAKSGPEHRFYLDNLTPVGEPRYFPETRTHLAPPDDPQITSMRAAMAVDAARSAVASVVVAARLQDGKQSAEDVARKLTTIREETDKALASLAEFL